MVLGFALLIAAILLLDSGFSGRSMRDTIIGTVGKGFALADINVPGIVPGTSSGSSSTASASSNGKGGSPPSTAGGARGIVDAAAQTAAGFGLKVVSGYRPGSTTTSGNVSDHSGNDASRAARDLGNSRDALTGPPTPQEDAAVEAIGQMFGKKYNGKHAIVDTFNWHGFRVQIIWRTPAYGGHMGHIHIGAHKA